ncbi:PaaI family thioesterase [Tomitella gaofuii]|uniref:PaaI family thioesterase n=1 Tax=Tomitella gaofuii TaxID=2760083 RepID=UPI0015FD533F|nr:PaaI family thioesterase [Tomitella gaofuii]
MREGPGATDGRPPRVGESPDGTVLTATRGEVAIDRATHAARRLIDALLRADRDGTDLSGVAERLEAVVDDLDAQAPTVQDRLVDMWSGEGITRHDPVTGPENAIAPPLTLSGRADGSVDGEVTMTIPYQGPPTCVHGGVSALLLDHTLGVANSWAGRDGMTAQLTLRYHQPTPLFRTLTVSARQERAEGRKIWTVGEIRDEAGELCVSAEGLFIDKKVPRPRREE